MVAEVELQQVLEDEVSLPRRLVRTIEGDPGPSRAAVDLLLALARDHALWELPEEWLVATALALRDNAWALLTEGFLAQRFLGDTGKFLIVAPYAVNREGRITLVLSAIYGSVIRHPPPPDLHRALCEMFRDLRQPVTRILPITCEASCGNVRGESGEAFVVPDGWAFPRSVEGPALNDMGEQRRRFVEGGRACIRTIFDAATADLLLESEETPEEQAMVQHEEYQFHEAGHASGIGLTHKLSAGLLATWWHGAVEEWRSDGVAFELAGRILGEEEAGRLVASNFCTRFGVDSHRLGGPDRDRDVAASLLTFDHALRAGAFKMKGGKLALRDLSYRGLFAATAPHRMLAVRLTQEEMALGYEIGIHGRYGGIAVEASSRMIFDGLVRDACEGMFKDLR